MATTDLTTANMTTSKYALIASDRVEGTEVRRPKGDKVGAIERLMIDKVTGKVAYAVLSFGGFLGMGNKHLPIPWELLNYNTVLDAYELDIAENVLRNAPAYESDADFDWGDRSQETGIYNYYNVPPYWGI
jgi:hypothetical protein